MTNQVRLDDPIGDFRNDNLLVAVGIIDDRRLTRDVNPAAASRINIMEALRLINDAAGREVRSRNIGGELRNVAIRMIDPIDDRTSNFAKVMRWDFRSETNGDTLRTIDQKIWETGR